MAAIQQPANAPYLSRTRSGRVPANSSKPLSTASSRASPALTSHSASDVSSSAAHVPTTASNLSLFLTNLRLLDLDGYPDWPDINQHTFSAKDAAQGQKKRVACIEWALYQLFLLWDPEEARNKLQPFFPPLDQVQSLNLRAALLRSLEAAKKSGVLGRDAVVRKTMLDECKGERLAEVLAVFSSAVLKKLVAEQQEDDPRTHPAIAEVLALESRGYAGERPQIGPLVLAHKVSLRRRLEKKNVARTKYADFADLLDLKDRNIARRSERLKALSHHPDQAHRARAVSHDEKLGLWRAVRNNWSGNEQWLEGILYGGHNRARGDPLLGAPFDRVWRRVQTGRLDDLEDHFGGLLDQLDDRVRHQRERLQKWQGFRERMLGKPAESPSEGAADAPEQKKGLDLGFVLHESLHLGQMSLKKLALPSARGSSQESESSSLILDCQRRLEALGQQASQPMLLGGLLEQHREDMLAAQQEDAAAFAAPQAEEDEEEADAISDLSELEQAAIVLPPPKGESPQRRPISLQVMPKSHDLYEAVSGYDEGETSAISRPPQRSWTLGTTTPVRASAAVRRTPSLHETPPQAHPQSTTAPLAKLHLRTPSPVYKDSPDETDLAAAITDRMVESPEPEATSSSSTQAMADQILASMSNASPSPTKKPRHRLSLAERTRLSMARGPRASNLFSPSDVDDDHETELDTLTLQRAHRRHPSEEDSRKMAGTSSSSSTSTACTPSVTEPPAPDAGAEDLVARTRKSMAGFEAARQRAQLQRRRSERKSRQVQQQQQHQQQHRGSYFPALDEEEAGGGGGGDASVIVEELLAAGEQGDEESVFMSRPRIQTSPVPGYVRRVEVE